MNRIAAKIAGDGVIALATEQQVIIIATADRIITAFAENSVAPFITEQPVITIAAPDLIVTKPPRTMS